MVQETFLQAFWKISGFRGRSSFYTWLYRIALNLCYRRLRQKRREIPGLEPAGSNPEPERLRDLPAEPVDPSASPREQADLQERVRLVRRALARLPEPEFQILLLREMEGFSYDELAHLLGLPKGTVMSRLHRARLSLARQLTQLGILA